MTQDKVTPDKLFQKKALGQVFLKDHNIVRKTIEVANIQPEDQCLEIGCGDGIISEKLAKQVNRLHIIELDSRFLQSTQERLSDFSNVHYYQGDVLKYDLGKVLCEVTAPIKVIANIPYYLSAKLIQWFVKNKCQLGSVVVIVQKEFAQKLVAKAGDKLYSSLTVFTQCHFDVHYMFKVSKACFRPIPKVDSAVLSLTPRPLSDQVDPHTFFPMVNALFWGKRKTIKSCLRRNPYHTFSKTTLANLPENMLERRGETMDIGELIYLHRLLCE